MMRVHEIALVVTTGWRNVVVILAAVALHAAVTFYPVVHVRRGDGIALGVLVRIGPVVPVVLRCLSDRSLGWSVILRFRGWNRLVCASRLVLRHRYRFVIGGSVVFGIIGSRLRVVRGNGLSRGSGESVRVVRSRWYVVGGLEIVRHVRAQSVRRRVRIRRSVADVPVGIVVRIVGRHAVVTSRLRLRPFEGRCRVRLVWGRVDVIPDVQNGVGLGHSETFLSGSSYRSPRRLIDRFRVSVDPRRKIRGAVMGRSGLEGAT